MLAALVAMILQAGPAVVPPSDRKVWLAKEFQRDETAKSWFSDDDYPPEAVRQKASGSVEAIVLVSEQGAPIACWVKTSSGFPVLDAKTCELILRRGKFTVARDSRGTPQRYTWTLKTRWEQRG